MPRFLSLKALLHLWRKKYSPEQTGGIRNWFRSVLAETLFQGRAKTLPFYLVAKYGNK